MPFESWLLSSPCEAAPTRTTLTGAFCWFARSENILNTRVVLQNENLIDKILENYVIFDIQQPIQITFDTSDGKKTMLHQGFSGNDHVRTMQINY